MNHIELRIQKAQGDERDVLVAVLAEVGYDGFEELEDSLLAYIGKQAFDEVLLRELAAAYSFVYEASEVQERNWNAIWEAGFEPVVVADFCAIRAHFHEPIMSVQHEIVITPKMSFGTGHHATTQLMILAMRGLDLQEKDVFDFGTGTGVLAILAERLGAGRVVAIDNDEWAVNNSAENVERNGCSRIELALASEPKEVTGQFDVVLANINRHILLEYMGDLHAALHQDATLLMSGLMEADEEVMLPAITAAGLKAERVTRLNGWIAIQCVKC